MRQFISTNKKKKILVTPTRRFYTVMEHYKTRLDNFVNKLQIIEVFFS